MPRITGRDVVASRLSGGISERTIQQVGQALYAGGEEIRGEASHMLTEGSISGKGHIVSAPGEPPNEDSGVLRTHIETTQVAPLQVEVSSNAPYAAYLEFGTSRMAPRPYMAPATERKREAVLQLVRDAVSRAVKKP